jgi:hypothetical protein
LAAKPDLRSTDVWVGEYGAAVFLQLMAYRLAGDAKYLLGARRLADDAVRLFFDADSPLPKASSSCQHYETITSADTLVYALLAVHLEESGDTPCMQRPEPGERPQSIEIFFRIFFSHHALHD